MEDGDPVIVDPDDPEVLINRVSTKPMTSSIDITLDACNVEDLAKFFEHISKLLRVHGRIKITIE